MYAQKIYWQGRRKDFWSGLAVIGAHEAHAILKYICNESLHHRKSGPVKTGPAGLAPTPMIEENLYYHADGHTCLVCVPCC